MERARGKTCVLRSEQVKDKRRAAHVVHVQSAVDALVLIRSARIKTDRIRLILSPYSNYLSFRTGLR
jgi:hypothetical protein